MGLEREVSQASGTGKGSPKAASQSRHLWPQWPLRDAGVPLPGSWAKEAYLVRGFQNSRPQSLDPKPFPIYAVSHPKNIHWVPVVSQAPCWTIALGLSQRKGPHLCLHEAYSPVVGTDNQTFTHILEKEACLAHHSPQTYEFKHNQVHFPL